ncbi:MAG TPA: tryptophan--tRNA ligase, partial [Acidobacteriota bacterium]|nr:tryptophan--tRNA ligase [Acidobacteriota bacterium]
DPGNSVLYSILKLFCDSGERAYWEDRFHSGGLGYREVKQAIFDRFMDKFGPMRFRRGELENQPEYVEEVLKRGAERARNRAMPLMVKVRTAAGLPNR